MQTQAISATEKIFEEKNGIVVMEVESAALSDNDYWKLENDKAGYTGSGYYAQRGDNAWTQPSSEANAKGLFTYTFVIHSEGEWRIKVRNWSEDERAGDKNDVWQKMGDERCPKR